MDFWDHPGQSSILLEFALVQASKWFQSDFDVCSSSFMNLRLFRFFDSINFQHLWTLPWSIIQFLSNRILCFDITILEKCWIVTLGATLFSCILQFDMATTPRLSGITVKFVQISKVYSFVYGCLVYRFVESINCQLSSSLSRYVQIWSAVPIGIRIVVYRWTSCLSVRFSSYWDSWINLFMVCVFSFCRVAAAASRDFPNNFPRMCNRCW